MDRMFDFEAQIAEAELWTKQFLSGEGFRTLVFMMQW